MLTGRQFKVICNKLTNQKPKQAFIMSICTVCCARGCDTQNWLTAVDIWTLENIRAFLSGLPLLLCAIAVVADWSNHSHSNAIDIFISVFELASKFEKFCQHITSLMCQFGGKAKMKCIFGREKKSATNCPYQSTAKQYHCHNLSRLKIHVSYKHN